MKAAYIHTQKKTAGFTIVELIIVVVVVGILAGVAIVGYGNWKQKTVENQLKSDLQGAKTAMESARNFGSGYPAALPSTFTPSNGAELSLSWVNETDFCIQASSVSSEIQFYITKDKASQQGICPDEPGESTPPQE